MVFQILALSPRPLELNTSLKSPERPLVDVEFPDSKSSKPPSPDPDDDDVAGEASPCSAAGTEVTSCDRVVGVPVLVA